MADHELAFGRVVATGLGRLEEPPLLYSARHGWRVTGGKAREAGVSVRDQLLARLDEDAMPFPTRTRGQAPKPATRSWNDRTFERHRASKAASRATAFSRFRLPSG